MGAVTLGWNGLPGRSLRKVIVAESSSPELQDGLRGWPIVPELFRSFDAGIAESCNCTLHIAGYATVELNQSNCRV